MEICVLVEQQCLYTCLEFSCLYPVTTAFGSQVFPWFCTFQLSDLFTPFLSKKGYLQLDCNTKFLQKVSLFNVIYSVNQYDSLSLKASGFVQFFCYSLFLKLCFKLVRITDICNFLKISNMQVFDSSSHT